MSLSCGWRRRWPTAQTAYAAALYANEASEWDNPVLSGHCDNCDGWHLYTARPRDAGRVEAMRSSGLRQRTVATSWAIVDDFGWQVHVTAYETRCGHCGERFSGITTRRGAPPDVPIYCSRTHRLKAQRGRQGARERGDGSRRLKS